MIRRIRSWIGIGVIGALVAGVAAFSVSDRRGDDAASTGQVPAPSGIVVGLSLLGPAVDLVAADVPTVLVAQVVGAAPVAAVELWADGEVVDRVVPDDAYTTFVARLRWTPPAGTHLLSARALGADAAVGVSNVLDLAATDAVSTEILGDGQPAPAPAPGATIRRAGRALGVSAPLAPTPDLPPLPPGLADLGNVSVAVTVKDCDATVDVTGAESGGLTLRRVDGSAPAVATADPTQTSGGARLQEPLGPGLHQYLAEQTTHGVRRVVGIGTASTPDDCGGTWTGDVRLTGGVLATTDGDTAEAYLYLSTQPGRWQRVPSEPQSAVPRTPAGFDFGPYLPVLDGRRLEVVAWGRSGGEVHELGRGTFTPAPGLPLGSTVGKTRAVDLVWIKTPASAGKPEVVAATGYVSKPGILSFRWSTTLPYVTHAVWQVFEGYPPGGSAQVQPPGVVLSGTTQGSAGVFPIDFSKIGKVFIDDQPNATVSAKPVAPEPGYGNLSAGQGVPQSAIGAPIVPAAVSAGGTASVGAMQPYTPVLEDLPYYYIRIIPFSGDQFLGAASNQVRIQTGPTQAELDAIEALLNEPPEQGDYSMSLKVTRAAPPQIPYRYCWSFVGWDQAVRDANYSVHEYDYKLYDNLLAKIGADAPICAWCYTGVTNPYYGAPEYGFFSDIKTVDIGLAGGKCSTGSNCPPIVDIGCDLVGSVIKVWDLFVYAIGEIKGFVVDALATLSGCNAIGGEVSGDDSGAAAFCKLAATIVVDAALIYFGIPPNLPSSKQALVLAKGNLSATLTELAKDQGVPCDELAELDSVVDMKGLTCEEIADEIVDQAIDSVYDQFQQAGAASGFGFPPGMKVMPAPVGQASPPWIDVTVTPNPGAPLSLKTCDASFFAISSWTPKPAGFSGKGWLDADTTGVFFQHPYTIPQKTYSGVPFKPVTAPLGQPKVVGGTLKPGMSTVVLASPVEFPDETASYVEQSTLPGGNPTTHYLSIPYHALMMHNGAKLTVYAASPCAGTAQTTVQIGPDLSNDLQTKGVSE